MKNIILLSSALLLIYLAPSKATREGLLEFIEKDQTNTIPYSADFDCVQFSEKLIQNAALEGYEAIPVMVGWKQDGRLLLHEFVAVKVEGEIFWVEPQNDRFYNVSQSGGPLCYTDGECVTEKTSFLFYDGEFK